MRAEFTKQLQMLTRQKLAIGGALLVLVGAAIWLATVRRQISSYSRAWSESRNDLVSAGRRLKSVGRMASCASCAFFALVW